MRTMKIRTRFTMSDLLISIAMFCVVSFALLEHMSIPIAAVSSIKMPLMYAGGICVLSQYRILLQNIMKRKYFYVLAALCVLCLGLLWTMYVNRNTRIGSSPTKTTVRLILYLVELFALAIILAERGESFSIINFLYFYMLVLTLATDFLLLTGAVRFNPGKYENYLVGTKFTVSYLHMNLLVFWVMRRQRLRMSLRLPVWKITALSLLVLWVSIRVDCMTGAIGCIALVGLFILMQSSKKMKIMQASSPVILFLFLMGSVLFSFMAEGIVSMPLVEHLIENVLGRNTTLTGRLNIYVRYMERMSENWLTGYGFGNGNAAAVALFGYANTQNAILQWILQVGIPTTCFLLFLMLRIFHQASFAKENRLAEIMPLVVLIYVYIILGMVETTFNMNFILWFALIFMLINENRERQFGISQSSLERDKSYENV